MPSRGKGRRSTLGVLVPRRQSALAREKDQSMPDCRSARHRSVCQVPGVDGGGLDARTGGRQRHDPGDRHPGWHAGGPHRAAEGCRCSGASCSTPTRRAARARNWRRTRAPPLLFHWKPLGRQVRIEGHVEHVADAEADAYYATRPRISRLGAWASDQSRALPDRAELERRLAANRGAVSGDDIPRPPHWSGYRIIPERFEFWQNMPFRLHDRTVYTRAPDGGWTIGKLYP